MGKKRSWTGIEIIGKRSMRDEERSDWERMVVRRGLKGYRRAWKYDDRTEWERRRVKESWERMELGRGWKVVGKDGSGKALKWERMEVGKHGSGKVWKWESMEVGKDGSGKEWK